MKEKTKHILIATFSAIFAVIFAVFSAIWLLFLHHYKGTDKIWEWKETDTFEISNIKTVEKDPNKDFVILNFADVQLCDLEDIFNFKTIKDEIDYLIKTTKPNLITLTGDQTWSNENFLSLSRLINLLESYKIPYAPVFGNHDFGNDFDSAVASQKFCCDLYERAPHCLFSRGPSNLKTLGNYVINITENGKIFRTLFMLDSGFFDEITDEQIAWLEWNAKGIKTVNEGISPQSMCFLHKPLPEFYTAFNHYKNSNPDTQQISEDVQVFYSLSGSTQKGVFNLLKSYNTTDIVCGHQHGNNFTLKYGGVNLTFALKTGELGGFVRTDEVNLNGATFFTLSGENTAIQNLRVPADKFNIHTPINA